jgi:hypothetical protein
MRAVTKYKEPLNPTRSLGPGYLVHIDLTPMPTSYNGMNYVLDARDNLTGYVEARAIRRKTEGTITSFVEDFYLRHPFIRCFAADNGSEFLNKLLVDTLYRLGVPIHFIPQYHPESNSPVERGHSTLKNTLAKWAADNLTHWTDWLASACYAENVTIKRTTGYTPHMLWYGREANFPIESVVHTWGRTDKDPKMNDILSRLDSNSPIIAEADIVRLISGSDLTTADLIAIRTRQIHEQDEILDAVVDKVLKSRLKDKRRWDAQRYIRKRPLQVGDFVLEHRTCLETTWSGKLESRWRGPFRIKEVCPGGTYRLAELDGSVKAPTVSGARLRKFLIRDPADDMLHFCFFYD